MLRHLFIKNFALIDELSIEFKSGLNIITGETGAGKSILIGALAMVLGDRAKPEVVRKDANKAIIEAIIESGNNKAVNELLKENQIDCYDELIIRREISAKGQSRCFINDSPVTLSVLKQVGDYSIDLHGQHDHQSLLHTETHIQLLDDFGGLGGLLEDYKTKYDELRAAKIRAEELSNKEQSLREKKNLFEFQLNEITSVDPKPDEAEELEKEQLILENAEKLYNDTAWIHDILYASDDSVYSLLVQARNRLEDLSRIDDSFSDCASDAYSAHTLVDEINKFVQRYNSSIDFNSERLEEIRQRLTALNTLQKKYGGSIQEVLNYKHIIESELSLAENFEEEIEKSNEKISEFQRGLSVLCERLSQKRQELSKRLSGMIVQELQKLGIANCLFDVRFETQPNPEGDIIIKNERYTATANGHDRVEFLISTNKGEHPKPLAKVASGGEISRIMLALKTVLAKSERLPILVFDEIDTGISGKIAQVVGFSLKRLSRYHQIISITHLPQIAALADIHFMVLKEIQNEHTVSKVRALSAKEHQEEVARILSGSEVTQAALKSAQELISASEQENPLF